MKKISLILALALSVSMLASCGERKDAVTDADGNIVLTVGNWPAKEGAALDTKEEQKKLFEEKYSNIKINPDTWAFDIQTYYPKAAAGLIPNVYSCYFTEGEKIIRGGYAKEMTEIMNKLGYADKLNPKLMSICSANDKIYYVPENCYSLGIAYNTKLFEDAGLVNADGTPKVPATWDELVDFAKIINEKTGAAGFAIPTSNNAGGWLFTPIAWSFGTKFMEQGSDDKWQATFASEECASALEFIKDLKWKHNVFPSNILIDNGEYQKMFATGQLAMILASPDITVQVSQYEMDKNDIGMFPVPAGPSKRVTLVGGKIFTVSNNSTDEQLDAAFKWFEYQGISPFLTDTVKASQQKEIELALSENRAVGLQRLQSWTNDSEVVQNYNNLVTEKANVDLAHFKLFNESLTDTSIELQPEEPVFCQDLYSILDDCLQAVLNDKNADCKEILKTASDKFQTDHLNTYEAAK